MKEENKIKKSGFFDNKDWYKNKFVIGTAALIFVVLFYFFFDFMRTNYLKNNNPNFLDTITNDSLVVNNKPDSISLKGPIDKLVQTSTNRTDTTNVSRPDSNLFKFHTSYDKIDPSEYSSKLDEIGNSTYDLFDELMLKTDGNEDSKSIEMVKEINSVLPFKTTLKILSISGKNLLLNTNIEDNQEILLAVAEANQVELILIVDKKAKILFATDQKLRNKSLLATFTNLDLSKEGIWCMELEESKICVLPIYHTFGKIGYAVIKSQ